MKSKSYAWIWILIIILTLFSFYYSSQRVFFATGTGESMKPTFDDCSFLIVSSKANLSSIREGDIVIVNVSKDASFTEEVIAHRVIENNKEQEWISTRGDNNAIYSSPNVVDGEFSYNDILGKVVYYFDKPNCKKKVSNESNNPPIEDEPPLEEDLPPVEEENNNYFYACNSDEWNSYVENNLQGLSKEEQLSKLKQICENPFGEADADFWAGIPNPVETKFYSDIVRTGCSFKTGGSGSFGVWAFQTSSLGKERLLPDNSKPTYTMQETGVCFPEI